MAEESNTDLSSIDSILSGDTRPSVLAALDAKRKETEHRDMNLYREIIKENIEYPIIMKGSGSREPLHFTLFSTSLLSKRRPRCS